MVLRYNLKDHIKRIEVAPDGGAIIEQRQITVQSYQTTISYNYEDLNRRIDNAWLAPNILLGVFERKQTTDKNEIHVTLGLQKELNVRVYDYDERKPFYFSWKNVIVDTVSIRYVRDEEGLIRFTTYGGGLRISDQKIHDLNSTFLNIPRDTVNKRQFDLEKLRDLCFDQFVNQLYKVRFTNVSVKEYRSIDHTLFQSRKYIDPEAERLKEIREDPEVKIESFESECKVYTPDLTVPIEVKFDIGGSTGTLKLRFPKISYTRQIETIEEQARIFYGLVDETVKSVIDEDYYITKQVTLEEIDTFSIFPEMVNVAPYKRALRNPNDLKEYFDNLDLNTVERDWLPHLRAIDELIKEKATVPEIHDQISTLIAKNARMAIKLLNKCNNFDLLNLGALIADELYPKVLGYSDDIRNYGERVLIAWAVAHEEDRWDIDIETHTVHLGNLRFKAENFRIDILTATLWKLTGIIHERLLTSALILSSELEKYQWCMKAAKALSPNDPKIPAAFRLVAMDRVPKSVREGDMILKRPVSNLSELDEGILNQFGLPLWPCFRAWREGENVILSNDGLGSAVNVVVRGNEGKDSPGPIDLISGENVSYRMHLNIASLKLTFEKYGKKRKLDISVLADLASIKDIRDRVHKLPKVIDKKRRKEQLRLRKVIDRKGVVIGSSPSLLVVFEDISNANAINDGNAILIIGEMGVGKTHIAKLIHDSSKRAREKFKAVNAGGSGGDPSLQRGEWIGYGKEHGISGIDKVGKSGHLMVVDSGTLFVDEFTLLSQELQGIFLSVLDKRGIEKVGGETFEPNVRCVFATNENIDEAIENRKIRKDLIARIGIRINIPPLRNRRGDVLLLAKHFVGKGYKYSYDALLELIRYNWPENVRELKLKVESALAIAKRGGSNVIKMEHIELPMSVIDSVKNLTADECQRELWTIVDEIARNEGFEYGSGLQQRAGEIMGVSGSQASKMYDRLNSPRTG